MACVMGYSQQHVNKANMDLSVKPGDDFATVCQVMGEPDFYDEGDNYDCAFYKYYDGDGEVRFYFHKDDPSWSSLDMILNIKQ